MSDIEASSRGEAYTDVTGEDAGASRQRLRVYQQWHGNEVRRMGSRACARREGAFVGGRRGAEGGARASFLCRPASPPPFFF